MAVTTVSASEFDGDAARARNAASEGPVFITDQGEPVQVLLSVADYRRLSGLGSGQASCHGQDIADLLAMPEGADVELEIVPRIERPRPADLA